MRRCVILAEAEFDGLGDAVAAKVVAELGRLGYTLAGPDRVPLDDHDADALLTGTVNDAFTEAVRELSDA